MPLNFGGLHQQHAAQWHFILQSFALLNMAEITLGV